MVVLPRVLYTYWFVIIVLLSVGFWLRHDEIDGRAMPSREAPLDNTVFLVSHYVSDPLNATEGLRRAAREAGATGGRLVFDRKGNYTTGAVTFSGTVNVVIPKDVRLLAGTERNDYPGDRSWWYLLHFRDCLHCSLSGGGILDGQGRKYVVYESPDCKHVRNFVDLSCRLASECRPSLIGIVNSTNFSMQDMYLIDPIYWSVHMLGSSRVNISSSTIRGDWQIYNTDGIDIDSSSDVTVVGCDIDTADDAICIKTTQSGMNTQRVSISDSRLRSRSSAIKIGSESLSNISDIAFERIEIHDSNRGLGIQLRDQGNVSNIIFRDIIIHSLRYDAPRWWGASEVAYVTATPRYKDGCVGSVTNVMYENVTCCSSENGIFLSGNPSLGNLRNVTMANMNVLFRKTTDRPGGYQDMRPGPLGIIRTGSTAAVWVEYAMDVSLEDVTMRFTRPRRLDWRENVHIDESSTENVQLKGCRIEEDGHSWMALKRCRVSSEALSTNENRWVHREALLPM